MFQVREKHMQTLKEHALNQYVDRTLAQFQEFFPRHCEINGDQPMRDMIRLGVDRAKARNIMAERNVILYTTMMLLFGSYFDEDPATSWAQSILADPAIRNESSRARCLYEAGEKYWHRIAGLDNSHKMRAIIRARNLDIQRFEQHYNPECESTYLEHVFPELCVEMGTDNLDMLRELCLRRAALRGLNFARDRVFYTILALLLGHRFDEDPMYPWAAGVVGNSHYREDAKSGNYLIRCAYEYADEWIAHGNENG